MCGGGGSTFALQDAWYVCMYVWGGGEGVELGFDIRPVVFQSLIYICIDPSSSSPASSPAYTKEEIMISSRDQCNGTKKIISILSQCGG